MISTPPPPLSLSHWQATLRAGERRKREMRRNTVIRQGDGGRVQASWDHISAADEIIKKDETVLPVCVVLVVCGCVFAPCEMEYKA